MNSTPEPGRGGTGLIVPVLLVVVAGIGYGSIFAANRIVGEAGFPPIPYVFWQAAIGAAFLLIVSAAMSRRPRLDRFSLAHYAASASFGQVIPFLVLAFVAVKLPSGVVTLSTTLIPALTYLFALTLRIESFRALSLAGIALGFAGVLMIVLPEGSLSETGSAAWVLVALLFPISAATNNMVVAKLRPPEASSASLAAGVLSVASLFLFGLMLIVIAGLFWALVLFNERLGAWVWGAVAVMVLGLALSNFGARSAARKAAVRDG
jgi:drug/metabolite transporter (DMT)-like permease